LISTIFGNSNLGPILHRFGDIAGFFVLLSDPQPCSTLILGVFPLHQMAHVGVSLGTEALSYSAVKLFSKNSNMWSRYLNVTDRRTDRRTDNIRSQYRALH